MRSIVPHKVHRLKQIAEVNGYILARHAGTKYHFISTLIRASIRKLFNMPLNEILSLEYQVSGSSEKSRSLSHASIYGCFSAETSRDV